MRRLRLLSLLPLLLLVGCPAVLSQPRGEEHIAAMQQGEAALTHHRDEEAVTAFATAARTAERRVDRDEAEFEEAQALERLGRYDEALVLLDRVGNREPNLRRTARAIYDAARIRLELLNQREPAMQGFERVVREHPEDGLENISIRRLVDDYEARGDLDGAIALLDRLYGDVGSTRAGDDLLRAKADLQLAKGDRAGARATLEKLVAEHPYPYGHSWDNALMKLAEMDLEDGNPRAAIERYETIVSVNEETNLVGSYTLPTMPEAQIRIARIYRDQLSDRDAASRAYDDVGERFPRSTLRDDAQYEAGVMWLDAHETRRGCRYLSHVVADFEVGHARRQAIARMRTDCPDDLPEELRRPEGEQAADAGRATTPSTTPDAGR